MNIPHKRPKRYLTKVGILAADFLVSSSLNISESMDLIKIEIECKILPPLPNNRICDFQILGLGGGGAEIFVFHVCRKGP